MQKKWDKSNTLFVIIFGLATSAGLKSPAAAGRVFLLVRPAKMDYGRGFHFVTEAFEDTTNDTVLPLWLGSSTLLSGPTYAISSTLMKPSSSWNAIFDLWS